MIFLDFERDLESLYEQLEKLREVGGQGDLDVAPMVAELEEKIRGTRAEIYANLTGWQKVQLSRHPERPYTLFYVNQITDRFQELHGDRAFGDDKAMVGGVGQLAGESVVFIGQQKGVNTKMRQYRNFGMSNPEGYRKALRLMKLAERFDMPVVSLIDTPGAFPGIEAEERGQAEAIARNLFEMAQLRVPIVSCVIGEGASGGAIGIGLSDRAFMMENTWYSVISPESCSSILWRSWDQKERAAEELHLTAADMHSFGIIDDIIREPAGGAHAHPEEMAATLKAKLVATIRELRQLPVDELIRQRIDKYDNIGVYREGDTIQYHSARPEMPTAAEPSSPRKLGKRELKAAAAEPAAVDEVQTAKAFIAATATEDLAEAKVQNGKTQNGTALVGEARNGQPLNGKVANGSAVSGKVGSISPDSAS